MENIYFVPNTKYIWIGALLTALAIGALLLLGDSGSGTLMAAFITVWLTFWSVGVVALVVATFKAWKAAKNSRGGKAIAIFLTLFSLPFIGGECVGIGMLCALPEYRYSSRSPR